jgi:hypothetical protein
MAEQKVRLEKEASKLKPGPERDNLLRRTQQFEVATNVSGWLRSPGWRRPEK